LRAESKNKAGRWQVGQHLRFGQGPRPHLPPRQECGVIAPGLAAPSTIRALSRRALQSPGISSRRARPFADFFGPFSAFFALFFGAIARCGSGTLRGTADRLRPTLDRLRLTTPVVSALKIYQCLGPSRSASGYLKPLLGPGGFRGETAVARCVAVSEVERLQIYNGFM
jgi:hypothetical protein